MTTSPALITRILDHAAALPPDLVEQLQSLAASMLSFTERLKLRDERIRRAAALLPAGNIERKAARLAALSRRYRRATDEVSRLLLEAARYAKLPKSPRHYRRIIEGF